MELVDPTIDIGKRHMGKAGARSLSAVVAVAVALAVLAGGCWVRPTEVGTSPPSGPPVNTGVVESDAVPQLGGTIAYALFAETNGWNPTTNQWTPSGVEVSRAIFDTLTAFDSDATAQPFVAERFEHDASFTTWTFTIRSGVTYSNGKAVTAESIAELMRLVASSPIVGATFRIVTSIEVIDGNQVRFGLREPWSTFPSSFSTQLGVVADPDWVRTNDSLKPVGTGPFVLDEWMVGDRLRVKKNPNYWRVDTHGIRLPYLDGIDFRIIPDGQSRVNALEAGDVDIAQVSEPARIAELQESGASDRFQVFSTSNAEMSESFVVLNTKQSPFNDPDARLAVALATNGQDYVDVVMDGTAEVAQGPFARNSKWYSDPKGNAYDPERARQLVDKVKAAKGSFAFHLDGRATPDGIKGMQALQQMYSDVGMDVTVDSLDTSANIIKMVTGAYQAKLFAGWSLSDPLLDLAFIDPANSVEPPAFSLNFSRIDDPAIGEAIRDAHARADFTGRKEAMARIVELVNANAIYVWLAHEQVSIVASKRLVNVVRWTLPDGQRGLDLDQGAHTLSQIWVAP